ncbi:MAG: DUF6953 family protein [Acidimicrobiales bacterium]
MPSDSNSHTALEIANWMLEKVNTGENVYQEVLVFKIRDSFGDQFVYQNDNGNLAIDKRVLVAFGKVSGDAVVWERGGRLWRLRKSNDKPGRQQY